MKYSHQVFLTMSHAEYRLVIAIGVGFTVPWLNVNSRALALMNIKQKKIVKIYFIFNN